MKLNGIVFDLDHTLFDRYKTIRAMKNYMFNNLKDYIAPDITPETFADNLCKSDKAFIIYGWQKI